MRQIALDTETTGLSYAEGHKVIEIGAVELFNRRLTGKHFHYYINPGREVEKEALRVHGISNEFLADKPAFSAIANEFIAFIKDAELIIHNADFDVGFLDFELRAISKTLKNIRHYCTVTDTLLLARKKHPGQQNNLDALCKRYHVDNSSRDLHGALLDAKLLAHMYLAMTGGQGNLFEETQASPRSVMVAEVPVVSASQKTLKVIRATAEEKQAHQQWMQRLAR